MKKSDIFENLVMNFSIDTERNGKQSRPGWRFWQRVLLQDGVLNRSIRSWRRMSARSFMQEAFMKRA